MELQPSAPMFSVDSRFVTDAMAPKAVSSAMYHPYQTPLLLSLDIKGAVFVAVGGACSPSVGVR